MDYRIKEQPGYSPKIGELVSMLEYTRAVTLVDLEGLSTEELDYLADGHSNSIGALLMHMAAIEFVHQVIAFENRDLTEQELEQWIVPLELGDKARSEIRGHPLDYYLAELKKVRDHTLSLMENVDDSWLYEEGQYFNGVVYNKYFLWFHVVEDETSHRGQIRILKRMLENRK
ncbi:DinB family protein [Planococcus sp. CP5-4]|uniref:DinB family protein n=1 Tax=unclassified Planococcus (in: firmicutes) TaxID=2662419 RepID=UPI001C229462|nr:MULTISPECIES: DinB family protein [unclassified Planococcus (in: firmicutes)]MBU9674736.1 DinB family protein [Planococcus sp. CP5-4_YE]MBV0910343.1 DinB family protein [Planococcus sp. CP5-4_UN]MBW6063881.1 DinB family protein [Planococcus sp. CP5-4]